MRTERPFALSALAMSAEPTGFLNVASTASTGSWSLLAVNDFDTVRAFRVPIRDGVAFAAEVLVTDPSFPPSELSCASAASTVASSAASSARRATSLG